MALGAASDQGEVATGGDGARGGLAARVKMPSGLLALGSQPVTAPVVAFTLNSLCRVARAPLQLKPPPVPWVPLPVRQTLSWWPPT